MPRELRLDVDGLSFAAQDWGAEGQMPVMALHGWLDNSASFNVIAPQLTGLHLVALDLAGHGQSDHRPGSAPYNIWEDVAEVFAIADQLGWERFALLGHSRGAMIGMLAAGTFPERISHLALVEGLWPKPPTAADAPGQLARSISEGRALACKPLRVYKDLDRAVRARERGMFPLSYQAASALTERGVRPVEGGYTWSTDQRLFAPSAVKLTEDHIKAFIQRIEAPVKLILAEEGIPEMFPHYREALDLFSPLNMELLPGGHHLHMEEQADKVATILQPFFDTATAVAVDD
ncbi:alpha/beta fold hydrolase [Marinimicrobium sp. ABcell2]|uniref:alpha/beta fold hydrolase n=1 Tax=Marinimicrobium sp. ABcell2 TaxID=3069751 RepID=UPI0027AFD147|nr:alpha/beta hydrolase [Marinimicrobium sp. ABcell2]MDQ2075517.1 alpha/beta hydrolase [Marinimicrobium sp. ABcell2]